jgi:AraC-like DNA-binding protein
MGVPGAAGPSVAAGAARRVVRHAVARGVSPGELAPIVGGSLAQLDPTSGRVPLRRLFELWTHLARVLRDPALPIRVAEDATLEDLDLLGFTVLTAPTVELGLGAFVRYARLLTTSARWTFTPTGRRVEARLSREGSSLGLRLSDETAIAQFVRCMRQLAGPSFDPLAVSFRHPSPGDASAHAAFFQAPVRFSAHATGVTFARDVLDATPPSSNGALHLYLCRDADAQVADVAPAGLVDAVTRAIARELDAGRAPDIVAIARTSATTERTLRRRLGAERKTFRGLCDDVRRARAIELLADGGRSLAEAAFGAGFSDSTAFAHACRRWFGESPRAVRSSVGSSARRRAGHLSSS